MQRLRRTLVPIFLITSLPAWAQQPQSGCGYYTNSFGHLVPRPCGDWRTDAPPSGASAKCRDGTYSFSEHHSGACSGHGGIAAFLR